MRTIHGDGRRLGAGHLFLTLFTLSRVVCDLQAFTKKWPSPLESCEDRKEAGRLLFLLLLGEAAEQLSPEL